MKNVTTCIYTKSHIFTPNGIIFIQIHTIYIKQKKIIKIILIETHKIFS